MNNRNILLIIWGLMVGPAALKRSGKEERPLIIAHRGYSGKYPEHSIKAYEAGIEAGADYIECDVQFTKDSVPVCHHNYWLSETTDIATKTDLQILKKKLLNIESEGRRPDWRIWDLTFDQIKTLRLKQAREKRSPDFNGMFSIPTLDDFLNVVYSSAAVGAYIELKNPAIYNRMWRQAKTNQTAERHLLNVLERTKVEKGRRIPVILQSFEMKSLMKLSKMTDLPLVFLSWEDHHLKDIHCFKEKLYGVGIWKNQSIPLDGSFGSPDPSGLVEQLHGMNLKVHVYTFRNDELPNPYLHDPYAELDQFYRLGVDGFFTDHPETLDSFLQCKSSK